MSNESTTLKKISEKKQGMVKSKKSKVADWIIAFVCLLLIVICLLPMVNILARSLSSASAIANREVGLLPVGLNLQSYELILKDKDYVWSLEYTAILTVICTIVSMTATVLCAYPLTYDRFKGRTVLNMIMILTMYFSAGTIPNYLLMKSLDLINNPLVLIIPNCLSVFNVIILRSFFFSIPESLRESAEIEGANPFQVLINVYLPLSTSVLATLALFYAVGRWNGFGDALLYINDKELQPIQQKLYYIINNASSIDTAAVEGISAMTGIGESLKSATIMFATIPILLIYPWLQKYFIVGVSVGAVKE